MSELTAHKRHRIKAVQTIGIGLPSSSGRTSTIIACTVSSDGNVNLYDIAAIPDEPSTDTIKQIEPLTTYDSKGTRLTCVTLADGDMDTGGTVNGKRKRENEDGNRNENGDDEHEHRHESDQEELDSGSDEEELEDEAEKEEEDQSDSD